MQNPLNRSISQLEGWNWKGEIPVKGNSTYEEYNYYMLHNKPLCDYTKADVYFMIGQEAGMKYFLPMAIGYLNENLMVEAEDYPGDLLHRLTTLDKKWWDQFPDHHNELVKLLKDYETLLADPDMFYETRKLLRVAIRNFLEVQ